MDELDDDVDQAEQEQPAARRVMRTAAWVGLTTEVVILVHVVDVVTGGAVSAKVQPHLRRGRRRLGELAGRARRERELVIAGRWVVWQAIEAQLEHLEGRQVAGA